MSKRFFASDNSAGVHPEIMKALQDANQGHVKGYGDDELTRRTTQKIKDLFGGDAEVFFVFNGTGANTVAIASLVKPFQSVICATTAHINVDECGAPQNFAGCSLLTIDTPDGKLTPQLIEPRIAHLFGVEHHSQPAMISISQPTELGTVYSRPEIEALCALAKKYNLYVHIDGARISKAVASSKVSFNEMTRGVNVISLGGTKNGMMYGEALVFRGLIPHANVKYIRKQGMQLASKMRYIAAQFDAYLTDGLWLKNAADSNKMARLLAEQVSQIPRVKIVQKVESNAVFAQLPAEWIKPLQDEFPFYVWDEAQHIVRWMTSWDTTEDDVCTFVATMIELYEKKK